MEIRNAISPILFVAMLFYYPGCLILDIWLPKYHESLLYLGILMPIIVYTSKVSLLTNNYLKAYRAEKKMLWINVISVVIAVILFIISTYVMNNLTLMIVMIVLSIMLRSIVSEIVVMNLIHIKMFKDFVIEGFMTIIFIISAKLTSFWIGFAVYFAVLLIYLWVYRDSLKQYIRRVKKVS